MAERGTMGIAALRNTWAKRRTSAVATAALALDKVWQLVWMDVAGLSLAVWIFVACSVVAVLGLVWDGGWHASWGRDTFFIPPHDMLYTAVTCGLGLSYLIIVAGSLRPWDPALIHIRRLQAPPGVWTVFLGCLMLIGAAPFDDWWHRTFGRDDGTGLWSPPHAIGMTGGLVVTIGILIMLRLKQKAPTDENGKPRGLRGLSANDTVSLLMFGFVSIFVGCLFLNFWAIRHWYRTEGLVYPILTMLFGPALAVLAQRVTGRAGAATVMAAVPFVIVGAVGAILKAAHYPIVISLPVMALPTVIVLDLFYARFGSGYRWLLIAGPLAVLAFYPSEFWWSWYLNGQPTWSLDAALRGLPIAIAVGTASGLLGAWLAARFKILSEAS